MPTATKLTPKQEKFIEFYMIEPNSAEAARKAGFKAKNAGSKMLANKVVSTEISRRMELRAVDNGIKADDVLKELVAIGMVNLHDYMNPNGTWKEPAELTRQQMAAVQSIKQSRNEDGQVVVTGYEFYDKTWGLEQLMIHLGMKDDRLNVNVGVVNPETFLATILDRAKESENEANVLDATSIRKIA